MPDYVFHIYFFGLICHMGAANKKYYAAMVRDSDHDPLVIHKPEGEEDAYPIDRNAVAVKFEIDNIISTADATTTAAFNRYVPSLQALMGGRERSNIEEYAIKVRYPNGNATPLAVSALYTPLGWYIRSGTRWGPDCVAQLTGIDVTVATKVPLYVVSFDDKGNKTYVNENKPFYPGDCLVIANKPNHRDHVSDVSGHVRKYGKLLIEDDSLVTVAQPGKCVEKAERPYACEDWLRNWLNVSANDVECGNTNWP